MANCMEMISKRSKYSPGASVLGIVTFTGARESVNQCERKQKKSGPALTEGYLVPGSTIGLKAELRNLEPLGVR